MTALGVFNIVLGSLIGCGTALCLALAMGLSGGSWGWYTLIVVCLPVAGGCHALGGAFMLTGDHTALKRAVLLLTLAICFVVVFMLGVTLPVWVEQMKDGGDDSEGLVFVSLLPGHLVLIAAAEIVYVCLVRKRQRVVTVAGGDGCEFSPNVRDAGVC
jgi:hypothetical protein